MAVALHGTQGQNANSTKSTTASFQVPSIVTAGDIWICNATLAGGGPTATISGVPAGFHLIARSDTGVGTGNAFLLSYWYLATGSETGIFATITTSASAKSVTGVDAFAGCNTTAPQTGSVVDPGSSGLAPKTTPALAALSPGQCAYGVVGLGGAQDASIHNAAVDETQCLTGVFTSGGALAVNCTSQSAFCLAATDATSQTWTGTSSQGNAASTAIHAFILDPAPVRPLPVRMVRQAVNRAASY